MKKTGQSVLNDAIDNRLDISNHKTSIPKSKLSAGSIEKKYPVLLDDGRTIVYISDKGREREIRLRYGVGK
jgi:hypothetical protein